MIINKINRNNYCFNIIKFNLHLRLELSRHLVCVRLKLKLTVQPTKSEHNLRIPENMMIKYNILFRLRGKEVKDIHYHKSFEFRAYQVMTTPVSNMG